MSSIDKKARIEAMKAKKAAGGAARGGSGSNTGAAAATAMTSLSRATVTGTILSVPRNGERCKYVDVMLQQTIDSKGPGRMLMPYMATDVLFSVAPFTDEKGDYPCKFDSKYQKTELPIPFLNRPSRLTPVPFGAVVFSY